jgi:membrane protease YdiL (CAAX protease family)
VIRAPLRQSAEELAAKLADVPPSALAQVGAVALASTLALLPVAWLGVRRLVPQRNVVFARWGFSHVGLAILLLVGGSWLASVVWPADESLQRALWISAAGMATAVAGIVFWSRKLDPDGVKSLGVRAGGNARAIAAALLLYAAAMPGILGLAQIWHWILQLGGRDPQLQEVAVRFAGLPPEDRLVPLVLGIAVVPLFEELLFRAFLQPLLVQNVREVAGVALTSAIFASLHGIDVFLPLFALSCVLGAVMLRTQRLAAVWVLHALNNAIMFAILIAAPKLAGVDGP